jgi:hypothetical protein
MPVAKKPKQPMKPKTKQPTEDALIMAGLKKGKVAKKKPGRPWPKSPIQLPATVKGGYKYDWDAAREMFITAEPALKLKQLALRTGIPYQQVRNRCTKERWIAVRAQEKLAQLKERRREQLQSFAGQAIEFDQTSVDIAKLGQGVVAQRLVEITKLTAAHGSEVDLVVQKIRNGEPLSRYDLKGIVDYREILGLAQAAEVFQRMGRIAMGSDVIDDSLNQGDAGMEQVVSIGGELSKDDPNRLAAFLEAAERAGLAMLNMNDITGEEEEDPADDDGVEVIEGDIVKGLATNISTKAIEGGNGKA